MKTDATAKPFLSEAECNEYARLLERKYASFLKQRIFEVAVRRDGRGVYAKVTLRNQSGSFYYPVEGRLAHDEHEMSERDAAHFLLDYIETYFDEYFREDGGIYLPIDWADYEWEGISLQLRGQVLNLEAERLADQLLESGALDGAGDQEIQ